MSVPWEWADGTFCLKAVSNLRSASVNQWGFFYMARDKQHSRELGMKQGEAT
jgi:hypothetical protein